MSSTWMMGRRDVRRGSWQRLEPVLAGDRRAALYQANNPNATPAQVKSALQAAGNLNWNDADDPDSTKESLLNVGTF